MSMAPESLFPEADSVDRLVTDFVEAHRRGERPAVDEFAARSSAAAQSTANVRGVLSAALALEKLKKHLAASSDLPITEASEKSADAESACGRRLGDFQLLREIGRGGMGIVYEAEQLSLARRVAVKVLRNAALPDDARVKRFEREAQAAARLHHTNIIPVFGVGQHEELHYYVMPLIDGVGLDRVIGAVRRLSEDAVLVGVENGTSAGTADASEQAATRAAELLLERKDRREEGAARRPATSPGATPLGRAYWRNVARIGKDAAEALHYAHGQGLLHRDIKPANLIVDRRGMVWLADFGLAKTAHDETLTGEGDVVGTLRYMAPENLQGQSSARGDVCSLGLTLYELAVLRAAFDDTDRRRLLDQIARHEPPSPRRINPGLPRDLETILLKAIAREPSRRYASAQDLADDLRRFLEDRPIRARRIGLVERFWRWRRANPAAAFASAVAATVLLLAAVAAALGYFQLHAAWSRETKQRQLAVAQRTRAEINLARARTEQRRAAANLEQALAERRRAEANLAVSLEVFEEVFDRVAPHGGTPPPAVSQAEAEEAPEPNLHPLVTREDAALLQSLLRFYDRFTEHNRLDVTVQRQAASAHRRVGDIQQRLGAFAEAEAAYRRALAIYEELQKSQPPSEDRLVATASIHNELGLLYKLDGRRDEAQQSHKAALKLLRDQMASAGNRSDPSVAVQRELVRTYNFLGFAIWGGPRGPDPNEPALLTEAEDSHRKALALLERLLADDPRNPEYRLTLARSYRDLAPVLFFRGLPDDALSARQMSLDTLQELIFEYPSVPLYRYELIVALAIPDPRDWGPDGAAEGKRRFQEAFQYAEQLAADFPSSVEYASLTAYISSRLGRLHVHNREFDEAEAKFRQALSLSQQNMERFPGVPSLKLHTATAMGSLAELLLEHRDRPADAKKMLLESIALIGSPDSLAESGRWFARWQLAWQYGKLSRAHAALGENDLAEAAAKKAEELGPRRRRR